MHPARTILATMLFGFLATGLPLAAEGESEALDLDAALENAQLRSYFAGNHFTSPTDSSLSQYRAANAGRYEESRLAPWKQQLIDLQIEEFVKEMHRKSQKLEEYWQHLDQMRAGHLDPRTWKSELEKIEKQANDLRGNLKAAFPELTENKSKEGHLDKAALRQDPGQELLLIGREVEEFRKTLSDLLFHPTFITSVAALRADSPLDCLKRISTVARAVRESM